MIMKMFTVYDSKAEAHLPPFYCTAVGVAIRNFQVAAEDEAHAFCKHAADYTLFQIGEFDDSIGQCRMLPAKIPLGTALELRQVDMTGANLAAIEAVEHKLHGIQGGE